MAMLVASQLDEQAARFIRPCVRGIVTFVTPAEDEGEEKKRDEIQH